VSIFEKTAFRNRIQQKVAKGRFGNYGFVLFSPNSKKPVENICVGVLLYIMDTNSPTNRTFSNRCHQIIVVLVALIGFQSQAQNDSLERDLVITPRVNSAGHFPFTGALLNRHVNFDVNIFYERRKVGFFLFQSVDPINRRSYVNYFQPGVFKRFDFTPNFRIRVFYGYIFSQTIGFRDKDSDHYAATTGYWNFGKWGIENTALFFDLTLSAKLANRLFINYTWEKFRFDAYVWHRWAFANGFHSTSAAVAINFPKINLGKKTAITTGVNFQGAFVKTKT
jgi:hypothetical protein